MDRHDRTTTTQMESHVDNVSAHRGGATQPTGAYTLQVPIDDPGSLTQNPFPVLTVHISRFPNGITITDCGIVTHPSSTYSVDFKKYSAPDDGSPVTIETVTTSASYEAEDNGAIDNPDISAGDLIYLNLPATDVDSLLAWITFTID